MTLREKRCLFTINICKLIEYINSQGHEAALGPDGLRHSEHGLHYIGLAKDLNIYKNGKYLTKSEEYRFAGDYWKSLHKDNRWGGDFPADGNHFSMTHEGRS